MPNRCVAAGCGNMPSDSVSLFRFPKDPHLCGVWTRQVQRTRANWKPSSASVLCSEHFSVDCFDDIPALKASLVFAVQRKRVLKSTAVPSIFKRSADVPEKKARKSTAVEKLASKRVSFVCRVSYCLSQCTATEWVIAVMPDADNNNIINYYM